MYYRLVLLNKADGVAIQTWSLNLPATIGRNPQHSVFIDHESISRTHCRIELNGEGTLIVRDLNSTNGTYVRDRKVKRAELVTGETFMLGAAACQIEYSSEISDVIPPAKMSPAELTPTVPMQVSGIRHRNEPLSEPKKWWKFW